MNTRDSRGATRRGKNASALERTRRSSQRRLVRTVVLGTVAVAAAIAWMAMEFGMDADELVGYAVTSLMLVLGLVALALAGAAVMRLVRRLLGRRSR